MKTLSNVRAIIRIAWALRIALTIWLLWYATALVSLLSGCASATPPTVAPPVVASPAPTAPAAPATTPVAPATTPQVRPMPLASAGPISVPPPTVVCTLPPEGPLVRGPDFAKLSCPNYRRAIAAAVSAGAPPMLWLCWILDPCFAKAAR